ncbi:hypothetical protein SAMN05421780_101725 [Flexibacter flexilis DSM 6793]|uniref:Uncharacterized protein n=1 Tax=Flexibacter flexilis DSM 6793 TaxID=927664 RepID=A0A1I1EAZ3_9BACT|nr:hypothetical protein [Flexibacter flexilis]SFB84285.1 hypothetical protein SAMN05421780_101725 [Flexibacter flexilis DSM 6793]
MIPSEQKLSSPQRSSISYNQKLFSVFINYTAFFITSFAIAYFIYHASTVLIALTFHIPTTWSGEGIKFKVSELEWLKQVVVSVRLIPPLILAASSFIFYRIYRFNKRKAGMIKAFWLWMYLNSANFALGNTVADIATNTGVWEGLQAQRIAPIVQVFIAIVCIISMLIIGYKAGRPFLLSANSRELIKKDNKFRFVFFAVILPWLLGSVLFFLVEFIAAGRANFGIYLSIGLMLTPIINSYASYTEISLVKDRQKRIILLEFIVLATIMFSLFVVVNFTRLQF